MYQHRVTLTYETPEGLERHLSRLIANGFMSGGQIGVNKYLVYKDITAEEFWALSQYKVVPIVSGDHVILEYRDEQKVAW